MCGKFCEKRRKTIGVAIWKKFNDIQTDSSYLYYKSRWLQASSRAKNWENGTLHESPQASAGKFRCETAQFVATSTIQVLKILQCFGNFWTTTGCGKINTPLQKLQYLWNGAMILNENFPG